ncbi:aminoglycoside phosphotransferase family protein [Streptomyces sp. DSM 41524]|uniref:Aminoglycoside phosphotransferase family protein n=1 Tax=Streptomyces asiaticus subsp. ignotus TaxID=3098222 RepID=A0ABU7Q666_9ACTN|nr:aminoglycoside phosphotransferase family protein [Streptomyces sp. DSM 41524]
MSDHRRVHTKEWVEHFMAAGYPDAEPLAAGVEGAIYRLGDGTVAKVWGRRTIPELLRMQAFYQDVAAGGTSFATPEILSVETVEGTAVTVERELQGTPLQDRLGLDDPQAPPAATDCILGVLRELSEIRGTAHMRDLPVAGEHHPLWEGHTDFTSSLAALLRRRVSAHADLLREHVKGLDLVLDNVVTALESLHRSDQSVIHGDLFPENILVDDRLRPTAVLDFGFMSTAGDPAFDAAVSAAIFNMYGPYAGRITDQLTSLIAGEHGWPPELLVLYRLTYALATSNFFTDDGSDGHFGWCVRMLNDPEIISVVADGGSKVRSTASGAPAD